MACRYCGYDPCECGNTHAPRTPLSRSDKLRVAADRIQELQSQVTAKDAEITRLKGALEEAVDVGWLTYSCIAGGQILGLNGMRKDATAYPNLANYLKAKEGGEKL